MFRQTPGATKNSTGSSGTTRPKKTFSPVAGQAKSATTSRRYDATLSTRTPRHTVVGTRRGSSW